MGLFENKETHDSYGTIRFNRAYTGGAVNLFGSPVKHRDVIELEISEADISRELSNDYIHSTRPIIKVEMSQTQFAEAITSFGSSGIPCTISYRQDKGHIDSCPFEDKRETFKKEFAETQEKQRESFDEFSKLLIGLFEKGTIGKKDKENVKLQLDVLRGRLFSNTEFVYKQFIEHMDKAVGAAKGEVEGYIERRKTEVFNAAIAAQQLGLAGEAFVPVEIAETSESREDGE